MGWYYIIKIVLVFDGFFNYHFEPRQNMRNSLFVFGFQFLQCPKELGKESHTFVLGKSQTVSTKSW
jgi:hypothetical protein